MSVLYLAVCKGPAHLLRSKRPIRGKHHELGEQGIIMRADSGASLNPAVYSYTWTVIPMVMVDVTSRGSHKKG